MTQQNEHQVRHCRSIDSFHRDADNIFRVAYNRYRGETLLWKSANSFFPTGNYLKTTFREVTDYFNPPSRKASAIGRRSRPMADEDGGREGQVNSSVLAPKESPELALGYIPFDLAAYGGITGDL